MRVKEERKKAVLKLKIQNTRIMASSSIASWQIDGEKVETVTDFIFLDPQITVDSDCSHDIKRCLLLRRKAVTNLDSILKSRDTTLLTEVHVVKALYCHPAYLTYIQNISCEMLSCMNPKLESRFLG